MIHESHSKLNKLFLEALSDYEKRVHRLGKLRESIKQSDYDELRIMLEVIIQSHSQLISSHSSK